MGLLQPGYCGGNAVKLVESAGRAALTGRDMGRLAGQKVFFGHRSVGDDIVRGLRDCMASEPELKLHIVQSADPQLEAGPVFVECQLGRNGDPQSKLEAFAAIINKGMGREGGIAMFKYCYLDVGPSTDIPKMFEDYRQGMEALKSKYPLLQIVHITIPLTTVEPAVKAWAARVVRQATARELNRKRCEYNRFLVQTFGARDAIFDLAEAESTHSDGRRSGFVADAREIFTLAPEFTTDGGHLNEAGRRIAAQHLLLTLAKL